jgi:ABC-2 type transport system permease protein
MNKVFQQKQLFRMVSAVFFETIREPAVLFWGIVFPILMALGLGVAFTKKTDVTRKIAIIEKTGSTGIGNDTASFIDHFLSKNTEKLLTPSGKPHYYSFTIPNEKAGNQTFLFQKTGFQEAILQLKRGNISLIIEEINHRPVYHFDPSNAEAQLSYLILSGVFSGKSGPGTANTDCIKPLTLSGTRYIDFLIPGLIAMGIMTACLWGISYSIIDKRSKKLLRRMVATPMKKSHFLISLISVRIAMNFVEGLLLVVFAYLVFDFRLQGSVPSLLTLFVAGNISFAGISVLISSRTHNTEVGNGLINVVTMPMMVLSGIFFSYHNFPDWSLPFIQKLPLTLMADGLRSVFTEGAGLARIWIPSFFLTLSGIICFTLGLKIFKWH